MADSVVNCLERKGLFSVEKEEDSKEILSQEMDNEKLLFQGGQEDRSNFPKGTTGNIL